LLESIYEATTFILREQGYARLTFVEIARVARTSRTVLYRRWGTPLNLIRAITSYRSFQALGGDMIDLVEDTGSLRGDLLALMRLYLRIYDAVGTDIMNAVVFEMSQNNSQIPAITDDVMVRNRQVTEKIIGAARERGEAIKALSPAALTLPFDLIRVGYLWGRPAFGEAELEGLVDEILMPVFTKHPPSRPSR